MVQVAVAFVVGYIIDKDFIVVPAVSFIVLTEGLWEVKDGYAGTWSLVDSQHLKDIIETSTLRRESSQERCLVMECLAHVSQSGGLRRVGNIAREDNNTPAAVTPEQLLQMPRASIRLVEHLDARKALANSNLDSKALVRNNSVLGCD